MGANDPEYPLHRVLKGFLEDHERLVDNYPPLTLRIISISPLVVTQDGKCTIELHELAEKIATLIKSGQSGSQLASGGSLDTFPCAVLLDNYIPKVAWTKDGSLVVDFECAFPRVALYTDLMDAEPVPSFQAGFPLFQTEPYDFLLQNIEQLMILDASNLPERARAAHRMQTGGINARGGAGQIGGNHTQLEGGQPTDQQSRANKGLAWVNHEESSEDEQLNKPKARGTPGIGVAGLNGRDNMLKVKQTRDHYRTAQSQESITDLLFNSSVIENAKGLKPESPIHSEKPHINGSQATPAGPKAEVPTVPVLGSRKKSEVKGSATKDESTLLRKRTPSEKFVKNEIEEKAVESRSFNNLGEGVLEAAGGAEQRGSLKRVKGSVAAERETSEELSYEELLQSLAPESGLLSWSELTFSAEVVRQLKERVSGDRATRARTDGSSG